MKSILIIRSVSVQQLDLIIPELKRIFPETELFVLTHPHAFSAVVKNVPRERIFIYPYKANFSFWKRFKLKKRFSAIIVPSAGNSLGGVQNVLLFSLRFRSKELYLINNNLKLIKISRFMIFKSILCNLLFSLLASILTFSTLLLLIPFLFYGAIKGFKIGVSRLKNN